MMEQKLKTMFPSLRVNNASHRNVDQLLRIVDLCHLRPDLLVFVVRNDTNQEFFTLAEEWQEAEKINIIFLNKDDIHYYWMENEDRVLMSLKRKLLLETDCVVCMDPCDSEFYMCCDCGHHIHQACMKQCSKDVCSICQGNHFILTK